MVGSHGGAQTQKKSCGPEAWGTEGWEAQKFRALLSLSHPPFSLSGCLLVEFWWCFRRPGVKIGLAKIGFGQSRPLRTSSPSPSSPSSLPGKHVICYLRICDLFFDLLSYMITPALVVLPVVVKFVVLRLQSDRWMWRVSTLMHIWCMAQVCA